MNETLFYLPAHCAQVATHVVGNYAKELSNLEKSGVLLPKFLVIPQNTLKIIAQANNLQAKAYQIMQEINYASSLSKEQAAKQLAHLIKRQSIPQTVAQEFLRVYSQYFTDSFVLIKNAQQLQFPDICVQNIHSETNFVDAVLETWANISVTKLEKLLFGSSSLYEVLFPSPLLIQEQIEAKVSGVAYSFDTTTGNKNCVSVQSCWGVYTNKQAHCDDYLLDIRTQNILSKTVHIKKEQFRRVLEKLRVDPVLRIQQNQETLTLEQLRSIISLVTKIKRTYFSQIKVNWAIHDDKLYIEAVTPTEITIQTNPTAKNDTFYKLYTTVGQLKNNPDSDGVAVYNSGNLLFATATHPSQVVKTQQKTHLLEAMTRTLKKYIQFFDKPLLYRANNYTSTEFLQLQFGSTYEVTEPNPALGLRGGLRFLAQQEAFQLELTALQQTLASTQHNITLILPFVRSKEELTQVLQLIAKHGLTQHKQFSVWLELATPENMLNLSQYPLNLIQGVVCNVASLHALSTGIDYTNPDIAVRYSKNSIFLKKLIEHALTSLKETTKTHSLTNRPVFFVDLSDYDRELLTQLCELQIDGFIVNEQVTTSAKKCIIDTQQNLLL